MAENDQAADIVKRLDALKPLRALHEQTWRECYDYTHPIRGNGLQGMQLDAQSAKDRKARILDGTGTDGSRTLASALVGGLTPPNALWFKMERRDASQDELTWFDNSSESMWENIHASNYDACSFELAIDIVDAGWGPIYIDENRERGGYAFETWPIAQCYCATTKPGGPIDTVYRCFSYTAEQAVKEYGEDNLSADTVKLAKDKPDERVEFVHAIYPRAVYSVNALRAKNLPIASCHVEVKTKKLVREGGYHEMPVIVPRWMLIPDSVYAIGPAFDALPDMKELNEVKALELANLDLAIAGMWIAEDDGVLNARAIKLGARKVIVANSVDSMKPLVSGTDFNVVFTKEESLRMAIKKAFMADQLEPQDGPVKTATEIHVRVELIRQLLGPMYGRIQSEWLRPFLDRCFGLALRASQRLWAMGQPGVFDPPPDSLKDKEFTIKFISPVARAQSLEEVSAMDRHEAALLQTAAEKPEVLDTYNFDEAARKRSQLLGVPQTLINDEDKVAEIRDNRVKAQQAQQAQDTQHAIAQATVPKMIENAAA